MTELEIIIQEAIKKLAQDAKPITTYPATVISVDESNYTCELEKSDNSLKVYGVRLRAQIVVSNNGVRLIPKVGSVVFAAIVNDDIRFTYIAQYADLEKVRIQADTLIELNDGSNGGLINIADMVTKMNNLENKQNVILALLKTHVHLGVTVGAGASGPSTAFTTEAALTPTVQSDLENTKVTHG